MKQPDELDLGILQSKKRKKNYKKVPIRSISEWYSFFCTKNKEEGT